MLRNLALNRLSGSIPASIGSLKSLKFLYAMPIDIAHAGSFQRSPLIWCCCCRELGNNQLSDTIPSSLGSLVNMRELYEIAVLVVDGNVPLAPHTPVTQGAQLQPAQRCHAVVDRKPQQPRDTVRDSHTSLDQSFDTHQQHAHSDLNANRLSGTIPSSLANLLKLRQLYVTDAAINPPPSQRAVLMAIPFPSNLQSNQLQGNLTAQPELQKLPIQQGIALSGNQFTCPLPEWAKYAVPCYPALEADGASSQRQRRGVIVV